MRRYRVLIVAFLAVCLSVLTACSEGPATATSREQLTYDQILNTGLANTCPQLTETSRGSIAIEPDKSYRLVDLCLEPKEFFVEEEPTNKRREAEFVPGKLLTRYTTSLEQISGQLKLEEDGSLVFIEKGGIDFQPVTVQLPGGEQIPFMFTIKRLVAKSQPGLSAVSTATDFKGEFYVPSYRGNVFLDPKGRGVASGYDNAVALPSQADAEELARANVKRLQGGQGQISLQVAKVDRVTGEIAGTFESEQPSDTDLGADEPEQVKVRGIFYARVEPDFS
ncbi:MAG: photosystem II manganese-stabilizing polypeptide [Oscillatoria sp. PMC 1051.18]|uniref:photosystem II manganese-stabilizing polypeptide n=1 Tax=Oscillatoria salina TaxID=331517 RepID=UPI0013BBDFFE|nr:photosystem II manganese-stabilizing polypeptide [Oscillatoria salina]MBZ8181570.1 Photosystem II manganese-stabilizing polypeptide [Oscillatoria salina IIICB1]MEC4891592.1 photosystem II manganese-stabilizing polypeptide [Oscillatoria sp. PMC 1050.18]MEC5030415.1 photosystem II manganese-stabilizing polypeptide [Oscillatoria sp. PMC 1051.18]NET90367.1 Photosystem II manganese-stabilizing polypeptide [Kamptonema sp. SIO1D9]